MQSAPIHYGVVTVYSGMKASMAFTIYFVKYAGIGHEHTQTHS